MQIDSLLDRSRDLLVLVLGAVTAMLALALLGLILWRAVDEVRFKWRQRIIARYRPFIDGLVTPMPAPATLARLVAAPKRHRHVIADLVLAALRVTTGDVVPRLRDAAAAIGLLEQWTTSLHDRRWWVRAEAVRALGLLREPSCVDSLLRTLDDAHEEVRAGAVDALGRIGDPRCGPALLTRLGDESRHQRVRVVEAIRAMGPSITDVLLAHARQQTSDVATAIDVLGMVGATSAVDSLLEWSAHEEAVVRAAALRAIANIGLDDRSYFYALRGLDDVHPDVRGMAARALGRGGRAAAVPYLSAHLDDEWLVAAHCATGLRRMGRAGAAALENRAGDTGQGADLARQMLWELTFLRGAA